MKWKFWKRRPCVMCMRYAIRMMHIRKILNGIDRITRGRTSLTSEELMDVLHSLGVIHIEANRKEIK